MIDYATVFPETQFTGASKLKVLVCGLHYPYTMMSWFLRAFDRRNDVEMRTFGAFTGDYIPWSGGLHIPQRYVRPVDYPLSAQSLNPSWNLAESMLGDWYPDLVLTIDAGWHFADKPKAWVVAHVATDPHCLQYDQQRAMSDHFFCMQSNYMKPGDHFLPYAYDPTMNYHMDIEKMQDASLLGLHYPQRDALVAYLRMGGLNVLYDIGPIYDEYRTLNNQSCVVLSWSSLQDTPLRIWEAFGMQLPLVANRTPDLMQFFADGEDFLGFDSIGGAEAQVHRLIQDKALRDRIALNGYNKVRPHTWDARIQSLLEVCGVV